MSETNMLDRLVRQALPLNDDDIDDMIEDGDNEDRIIDTLVAAGYELGEDANGCNEYWPPEQ